MTNSANVTRRGLVAGGAGAALGALALGGAASAKTKAELPADGSHAVTDAVGTNLPQDRIGIQMYSIRDQVSKLGGMANLLRATHEVGFDIVEFAGNFTAADIPGMKAVFDELGMRAISQHASMDQASINNAVALGMLYTGQGSIPQGTTTDQWKTTAESFNTFGQAAQAKGLRGFAPHMHSECWTPVADAPGTIGLDVLLENTDPKFVFLEMDIYWAYNGVWEYGLGTTVDPVDYLEAFPSRFPLFHVKDGHYSARQAGATAPYNQDNLPRPFQSGMTDVHQGDIDFRSMFSRLAKVSDLSNHYFLWERDTANLHPHGSMSSARASAAAMRFDHLVGPAKY